VRASARRAEIAVDPPVELREYVALLARRKWSVILTTTLFVASILALSYARTPQYVTEARVLVPPLPSAPTQDAPLEPVIVGTETQVVASEPVANLVQEELGVTGSSTSLLAGLAVEPAVTTATTAVTGGSQVLLIRYTSADPQEASDLANAFARNYIEYRERQARENVKAARSAVLDDIEEVSGQIAQLSNEIAEARARKDHSLRATLESSRATAYSRLGVLQQSRDDLQTTSSVKGGAVLHLAEEPDDPSSPNHIRNGLVALVTGLGAGIMLALLRERLDRRFRDAAEVERTVRAPVLATVPTFTEKKRSRRSFHLVSLVRPRDPASEAYRSLRTNLQHITMKRKVKSIVITSAVAGEGKTVTTANLAAVLAQAGQRVIAVSADLRNPRLETYFDLDIDRRKGLSTWLVSLGASSLTILRDPVSDVRVVPCGPIPNNPAELLTSPRLGEMISLLEAQCDVVLIDSPPTLGLADAPIIAARVDGTILVINAANSPRSATTRVEAQIERAGGSVIGCVLTALDPSQSAYDLASSFYYAPYGEETEVAGSSNGELERRHAAGRR
jgi:capsular exopolysaccharide synthesis family protein